MEVATKQRIQTIYSPFELDISSSSVEKTATKEPGYVILMPKKFTSSESEWDQCKTIINQLVTEGCAKETQNLTRRIVVVLGVNTKEPETDEWKEFIQSSDKPASLPLKCSILPFTWKPSSQTEPCEYDQIPFGSIRNTIKNHTVTQKHIQRFYDEGRPVYCITMDPDFKRLCDKKDGKGILTKLDQTIVKRQQKGEEVDLISFGYWAEESNLISDLAVAIDNLVREIVFCYIPQAVYYTEAFFGIRVPSVEKFSKWTYRGDNPNSSDDQKGESKKLIGSAFKEEGGLQWEKTLFVAKPLLVTDEQRRIDKLRSKYQNAPPSLNDKNFMMGLWHYSQVSMNLMNFARSICTALEIYQEAEEMRGILIRLFEIYHPFYLFDKFLEVSRTSSGDNEKGENFQFSHFVSLYPQISELAFKEIFSEMPIDLNLEISSEQTLGKVMQECEYDIKKLIEKTQGSIIKKISTTTNERLNDLFQNFKNASLLKNYSLKIITEALIVKLVFEEIAGNDNDKNKLADKQAFIFNTMTSISLAIVQVLEPV